MKSALNVSICIAMACVASAAQTATAQRAPATAEEIQYFRYLLMTIGSPDYSPEFLNAVQHSLAYQFGLNPHEATLLRSAAQEFRTVLQELQRSAANIGAGKATLSPADFAALDALKARRDEVVSTLANRILSSVRSETAERLRVPGRIVAGATRVSKGSQ